jgi:S1-C subfamily serine protease
LSLLAGITAAVSAPAEEAAEDLARIRSAVVKIRNVSQAADYNSPWKRMDLDESSASGVIIDGGRILTVAHAVSDSRYLEVEKENGGGAYRASVAFIGHDCDLALLQVTDQAFFRDTASLPLGERTPDLTAQVSVFGFPTGGSRISITQGVVSRIDYVLYSHSGHDYHLILQIDAAVNPGNSGGPVLQDGKIVGLAFQAMADAENIGYVIPLTVIRHFLDDIADGVYHGYPDLGIVYSDLLNPAYRRFLKVPEERTGVAVESVVPSRSAGGRIFPGDVLTAIDGIDIQNDGAIMLEGTRCSLNEAVERKQAGEEVVLRLIREGEEREETVGLVREVEAMSHANVYDREPEYFVLGGLVFVPLSREYLKTWGEEWMNKADTKLLYYYAFYYSDRLYRERPEVVVLSRVLPAPVNRYSSGLSDEIVDRVNGRPISRLADLPAAFAAQTRGFHVIEFEDGRSPCILDAARLAEENDAILSRYGIARDRHLEGAEASGGGER